MENKKGSQLSSNGIMADVQRQENNSLDVNENNRDGFDFFLSVVCIMTFMIGFIISKYYL